MHTGTIVSGQFFHIEVERQHLLFSTKRHKELAASKVERKSANLDYNEYLKNPAGYFVYKEHWSLNGG